MHGKGVCPCGYSSEGGASLPARSGLRRLLGGVVHRPLRAGDDGRLRSRRPGAGATEKDGLPREARSENGHTIVRGGSSRFRRSLRGRSSTLVVSRPSEIVRRAVALRPHGRRSCRVPFPGRFTKRATAHADSRHALVGALRRRRAAIIASPAPVANATGAPRSFQSTPKSRLAGSAVRPTVAW